MGSTMMATIQQSLLAGICCWMAVAHTSYAITLVWALNLLPPPLGKVHMVLDALGHGLCFLLLGNWLTGLYCVWHVCKYKWKLVGHIFPISVAYVIDVLEMLLWLVLSFNSASLWMFIFISILFCSFWYYRLFYEGKTLAMLRGENNGKYYTL